MYVVEMSISVMKQKLILKETEEIIDKCYDTPNPNTLPHAINIFKQNVIQEEGEYNIVKIGNDYYVIYWNGPLSNNYPDIFNDIRQTCIISKSLTTTNNSSSITNGGTWRTKKLRHSKRSKRSKRFKK